MDFGKLIIFQARLRQEEPAVAFTGGVATYGMLAKAVLAAADRLADTGLQKGALVAIDVRNPFHHAVLIVALGLRGMVSASVQTSFNVQMSGLVPDAILVDGYARHPDGLRLIAVDEDWFLIDPATPPDFVRLLSLPGFPDENAVIRVIFSSGTTGVPKSTGFTSAILGKRLGHASLTHGGGSIGGIRELCLMGFSTLGGYMATIGALASGGVAAYATQPADVLHLTRMFNLDMLIVAVFQLQVLLQALGDARPPPTLRTLIVGGSKIPGPLLKEASARLCQNVLFGYGSTEAGSISHAPGSALAAIEGAAGYVVPWVTLEAVDEEDRPLPPGKEGIFRVRSDEQAHYVVNDPDNSLLYRDGWFYPGDIGTIREDGLVIVTGRSAEVINRGGSIVAPDLIERVLAERPGVKEAAAVGVPTRTGLDEICAVVVTDGAFNEQELLAFCRDKLADKAPGAIRRVSSIPRTDMGKIKRKQLREEVLAAQARA